jgi:hypothetical protein
MPSIRARACDLVAVSYAAQVEGIELPPEKLRPNKSSSGGSRSLGVVVSVMVSFVGSMSLIFAPTEALAWMLYALRHRSDALRGAAGERGAQWESEESNRMDRRGSIADMRALEDDGWLWWGRRVGVVVEIALEYYNYLLRQPKQAVPMSPSSRTVIGPLSHRRSHRAPCLVIEADTGGYSRLDMHHVSRAGSCIGGISAWAYVIHVKRLGVPDPDYHFHTARVPSTLVHELTIYMSLQPSC